MACNSAVITPVDTAGNVGFYSSITVGADGLGLVSYYDISNQDLKVAHCVDIACTSATTETVDSVGNVGQFSTSIATGADGRGVVAYSDETNKDLKVAHCSNVTAVRHR
jgi:hypothetical protein